jgi:iron complex outermembrane receptor protein
MKRPGFLLLCFLLGSLVRLVVFSPVAYAQQVEKQTQTSSLKDWLDRIGRTHNIDFIYVNDLVKDLQVTAFTYIPTESITQNLERLLSPLQLKATATTTDQFVITRDVKTATTAGLVKTEQQGSVYDAGLRTGLQSATVKSKYAGSVVTTDQAGFFSLPVVDEDSLIISFTGFQTVIVPATPSTKLNIYLATQNKTLDDVIISVGTYDPGVRSKTRTALPVDVLSTEDLSHTGRMSIGQILQYACPSVNTGQFGINNIASVIDPVTLRGLGPDQVLVLVNGKRRHNISGLNLNNTIGKGTTGTDFNAIPAFAVSQVEILRDGATTQYGSDAIAGVINLKLKADTGKGSYETQTGMYLRGDGFFTQHNLGYGWRLGKKGGFIQVIGNYEYQQPTDRGEPYSGLVFRKETDTGLLNSGQFTNPKLKIAENKRLDDSVVASKKFDRNAGIYGSSGLSNYTAWFSSSLPFNSQWSAYAFGGYSRRSETTYGFYRFPNNRLNYSDLYREGYLPEFTSLLKDLSLNGGLKRKVTGGWNVELGFQYAFNKLDAYADHTVNASMGALSPTSFYLGRTTIRQQIATLGFYRKIKGTAFFQSLNIATGATARIDQYVITQGDPASYLDANAEGIADSLKRLPGTNGRPGFAPENVVNVSRFNTGIYVDVEGVVSPALVLAAAGRYEYYSDFGSNLSGKLTARVRLRKGMFFRAGVNRGFRAPSLQQLYYSQEQSQIFNRNGQSELFRVKHFRNDDPSLSVLGVKSLQPETSWNISAGFVFTALNDNLNVTVDLYRIYIYNRIILSARMDTATAAIRPILGNSQNTHIQFFTNAIDTRTEGIDIVFSFKEQPVATGRLKTTFAASFNQTRIMGGQQGVRVPSGSGIPSEQFFTRTDIGIVEDAQPKSKLSLVLNWETGRFGILLRNTRFGSVTYRDIDPELDQVFGARIITDLGFNWKLNNKLNFSAGVNNLFNIYPDKVAEQPAHATNFTFNGQIPYSRIATPFGFNGLLCFLAATYRF